MIALVVAANFVVLVLVVALGMNLIADLLSPWPAPREHHEFHCAQCPCSYASAAELARHHSAMHVDDHVFRLPCDGGPARSEQ